MKEKWRTFKRLPLADQTLVVGALVLLPANKVGVRLLGLRRWQSVLRILVLPVDSIKDDRIERAERTARLVHAAGRNSVTESTCLERSLTLWSLLRAQGVSGELRIGGRREERGFEAHAWVEVDGQAVDERDSARSDFTPFNNAVAVAETPPR